MVKIDGSFVQDIAHDPIDWAMVRSMNDIAHSLGRRTVAECVENAATLRMLKECGVDFVQGEYLAVPILSLEEAVHGVGDPPVVAAWASTARRH
ncbi:phytochrome-like protein cph2 [bacterium BMS3Abin12]|nr:phytochrome-like protein cph2 [bacterium BMS3Abin12]